MTAAAGEEFAGLDQSTRRASSCSPSCARAGLLVHEENYLHNVGFCQRSGVRVQPLMSTQWFCDVSAMAARGARGARRRPPRARPGLVGEDLGALAGEHPPLVHLAPALVGAPDPGLVRRGGQLLRRPHARRGGGAGRAPTGSPRTPTCSTPGSRRRSGRSRRSAGRTRPPTSPYFYPTSVLITGFDILFFWVARMVMIGLHFTGREPVRARAPDRAGARRRGRQKMSKTKGNVLDPEDLVEEYGADAVRFTLALLDSPGRDIPLDPERMAGYRAFGNKIWNATRFALVEGRRGARSRESIDFDRARAAGALDPVAALARPPRASTPALEAFRFDLACSALPLLLERLLRLVHRDGEAGARAGERKAAGRGSAPHCARSRPSAAAPGDAVPHRGALAEACPGTRRSMPQTICLAAFPANEPEWALSAADEVLMELFHETVTILRNERADRKLTHRVKADLYLQPAKAGEGEAGGSPSCPRARGSACWARSPACSGSSSRRRPPVRSTEASGRESRSRRSSRSRSRRSTSPRCSSSWRSATTTSARCEARLASAEFAAKAPAAVVEGARKNLEALELERARLRAALGLDAEPG